MVVLTAETCWALNKYWINNKISGIKLVFSLLKYLLVFMSWKCVRMFWNILVGITHYTRTESQLLKSGWFIKLLVKHGLGTWLSQVFLVQSPSTVIGEKFIHVQFMRLKFYGNILQVWTFMDIFYKWEFYGLKNQWWNAVWFFFPWIWLIFS